MDFDILLARAVAILSRPWVLTILAVWMGTCIARKAIKVIILVGVLILIWFGLQYVDIDVAGLI